MNTDEQHRLWITPDRQRFFLIPADHTLPDGDLEIRSLRAAVAAVDPDALSAYEVGVEQAAAHVDAGWEGVVGRVRDSWRDFLGTRPGDENLPPDLGRWLGVTPGEAATDPEKQRQGRRTLIERVGTLFGADMNEDNVDRIDQRLEKLTEAVLRDAARLKAGSEKLATQLDERRPEIEATIEGTGETLVELGQQALQRLRGLGRKTEPDER